MTGKLVSIMYPAGIMILRSVDSLTPTYMRLPDRVLWEIICLPIVGILLLCMKMKAAMDTYAHIQHEAAREELLRLEVQGKTKTKIVQFA